MIPAQLLAAVRAVATVSVVDGRLSVRARDGALPSDLCEAVAARKQELIAVLEAQAASTLAADGRDIIAALARRGISMRLGDDGRPLVGPIDLVDEADRALLAAHRDAVLAVLTAVPEPQESADGEQLKGGADAANPCPGSDGRQNASTEHGAVHIDVPGGDP